MSLWRDFQGKHIASGKVLRCACVWRVSGVLEKQQEGLQDTLEGVGMDGGATLLGLDPQGFTRSSVGKESA